MVIQHVFLEYLIVLFDEDTFFNLVLLPSSQIAFSILTVQNFIIFSYCLNFPNQGDSGTDRSNPLPLYWKHRVLTSGLPGKSWRSHFKGEKTEVRGRTFASITELSRGRTESVTLVSSSSPVTNGVLSGAFKTKWCKY